MLIRPDLRANIDQFRLNCSTTWDTPARMADRKIFCDHHNALLALTCQANEVRCMLVPNKGSYGSVSPYTLSEEELYSDEWGGFGLVPIGRIPYVMLWNPKLTSGLNKTATKLSGGTPDVYGPAIFILLDHEYELAHMSVTEFKKHAISLLRLT